MRYIEKQAEPEFHTRCVTHSQQHGDAPLYKNYSQKKRLNDFLRTEQHNICCYCQRPIDHFYEPSKGGVGAVKEKGSRNEHLYPKNDHPESIARQVDYHNLFACCVDSMGHKEYEKHLRYCDVAKDNDIIPELIKEQECESYFRYTLEGEIIPNGDFKTWDEYDKYTDALPTKLDEARTCIRVLNLNCVTLKSDRKQCISTFVGFAKDKSAEELCTLKAKWLSSPSYPAYISILIQLIDIRVANMMK